MRKVTFTDTCGSDGKNWRWIFQTHEKATGYEKVQQIWGPEITEWRDWKRFKMKRQAGARFLRVWWALTGNWNFILIAMGFEYRSRRAHCFCFQTFFIPSSLQFLQVSCGCQRWRRSLDTLIQNQPGLWKASVGKIFRLSCSSAFASGGQDLPEESCSMKIIILEKDHLRCTNWNGKQNVIADIREILEFDPKSWNSKLCLYVYIFCIKNIFSYNCNYGIIHRTKNSTIKFFPSFFLIKLHTCPMSFTLLLLISC